ncbi:MAG: hypothetical protein WDM70_02000 [Nitrosomonadales bacterium]
MALMTAPVSLGVHSVAWPEKEIMSINAARVAGKTDDEIRTLITKLMVDRKNFGRGGGGMNNHKIYTQALAKLEALVEQEKNVTANLYSKWTATTSSPKPLQRSDRTSRRRTPESGARHRLS